MLNSKREGQLWLHISEGEICSSGGTISQQQPPSLQIVDCWNAFQENPVLRNQLVQFGRDALTLPDWSAQNLETLLRPWPGNITFPRSGLGIDLHGCTLHLLTSWRAFTCSVPHLCLAQVQRDACMDPQLPLQQLVNVPHPVWVADDTDVVQGTQTASRFLATAPQWPPTHDVVPN